MRLVHNELYVSYIMNRNAENPPSITKEIIYNENISKITSDIGIIATVWTNLHWNTVDIRDRNHLGEVCESNHKKVPTLFQHFIRMKLNLLLELFECDSKFEPFALIIEIWWDVQGCPCYLATNMVEWLAHDLKMYVCRAQLKCCGGSQLFQLRICTKLCSIIESIMVRLIASSGLNSHGWNSCVRAVGNRLQQEKNKNGANSTEAELHISS